MTAPTELDANAEGRPIVAAQQDGGAISVDELCAAMNAASNQILDSYRTWVADDTEAKPRYGQIPRYDQLNNAITRLEVFGLSTLAEKAARIAKLEAELIQSRNFWSDALTASRAECEGLRAVVRQARELLAGPLVGAEWKRACHDFVATADAALSQKETGA